MYRQISRDNDDNGCSSVDPDSKIPAQVEPLVVCHCLISSEDGDLRAGPTS